MKPAFSDIGIVLRTVDFGEADKLITIISHHHGMQDFIAKGARRLNSKKAPHLDIFNQVKFQIGRGYTPQLLLQAETVQYYPQIKANFEKTRSAMLFCEILNSLLPKEEDDKETYLSLTNFLSAINNSTNSKNNDDLINQFSLYLLRHLGYPAPKMLEAVSLPDYFETIINKRLISQGLK